MSPRSPEPTPAAGKPLPPSLNHDIHSSIVSLLAQSELAPCCRVSKAMQALALHPLYATLHVDPSKPHSFPDFTVKASEDEKAGSSDTVTGADSQAAMGDPNGMSPPNRFTFTTYLSLHNHTSDMCLGLTSPILPNLITLHINGGFSLCSPKPVEEWDLGPPYALCPLLAHLSPRRVVMGDTHTGLNCSEAGLSTRIKRFPPKSVEELVLRIGHFGGSVKGLHPKYTLLRALADTVKRLTLILLHQTPELQAGMDYVMELFHGLGVQAGREFYPKLVVAGLAEACRGKAGTMTIVGLEAADLNSRGTSLEAKAEEVKLALKSKLVKAGWEKSAAQVRAKDLRFVEWEEFDGEKEHTGTGKRRPSSWEHWE